MTCWESNLHCSCNHGSDKSKALDGVFITGQFVGTPPWMDVDLGLDLTVDMYVLRSK